METTYTNCIDISDKTFFYKELKVKHLKTIYKCLIGEAPDLLVSFKNFDNILNEIVENTTSIQNLNFFEYFLILLSIRCTSIGSTIFAEIPDKPNTSVEININHFINNLKNFYATTHIKTDIIDNFQITYRFPTTQEIIQLTTTNYYIPFIQQITFRNIILNFENISLIDKQKIIDQLPVKIIAAIIQKIETIIDKINAINLLEGIPGLQDKKLYFNLNSTNFLILLKIVFGDQLLSLYENIFFLSKQAGLSPLYIENCTPGEYILFVKKLQEINSKNNIQKNQNNLDTDIDPFESTGLPPRTSRSEFTP